MYFRKWREHWAFTSSKIHLELCVFRGAKKIHQYTRNKTKQFNRFQISIYTQKARKSKVIERLDFFNSKICFSFFFSSAVVFFTYHQIVTLRSIFIYHILFLLIFVVLMPKMTIHIQSFSFGIYTNRPILVDNWRRAWKFEWNGLLMAYTHIYTKNKYTYKSTLGYIMMKSWCLFLAFQRLCIGKQ